MSDCDLRNFLYGDRFFDPSNPGIAGCRDAICPLKPEESRELWDQCISSEKKHLADAGRLRFDGIVRRRSLCKGGWGDDSAHRETASRIQAAVSCGHESIVTVFWTASVGVRVPWRCFVQNWHTFFYPSDDSGIVMTLDGRPLLQYVEDQIFTFQTD